MIQFFIISNQGTCKGLLPLDIFTIKLGRLLGQIQSEAFPEDISVEIVVTKIRKEVIRNEFT